MGHVSHYISEYSDNMNSKLRFTRQFKSSHHKFSPFSQVPSGCKLLHSLRQTRAKTVLITNWANIQPIISRVHPNLTVKEY